MRNQKCSPSLMNFWKTLRQHHVVQHLQRSEVESPRNCFMARAQDVTLFWAFQDTSIMEPNLLGKLLLFCSGHKEHKTTTRENLHNVESVNPKKCNSFSNEAHTITGIANWVAKGLRKYHQTTEANKQWRRRWWTSSVSLKHLTHHPLPHMLLQM